MRTWAKVTLGAAAVLSAGLAYGVHAMVWGKPFGGVGVLVDRQGMEFLLDTPEGLTAIGVIDGTWLDFHSGRFGDRSWERKERDLARLQRFGEQLDWYEDDALAGQDLLTYKIARWQQENVRRLSRFEWLPTAGGFGGLYPINQLFGSNITLPRFMEAQHPVKNRLTAENYVARLKEFERVFAQLLENVRRQAGMGVMPPRFVLEHVIRNANDFVAPEPAAHPLVTSFAERLAKLEDLDPAARAGLEAQAAEAVGKEVYGAYRAIAATMTELLPQAAADDGVWKLPDGDAYYAAVLRANTTTDHTPDEVHRLGLDEVARLSAEMNAILDGLGAPPGTLAARMKSLNEDPQHQFPNTDEGRAAALARYDEVVREAQARTDALFERTPPQPVEVLRVPPYSEATSPGAYYNAPALDGSRPGRFFVNLRDMSEQPKWTMPTLAYHEAVPGHHWQISWAQTIEGIPYARRLGGFTVYSEGWALYAELLMDELGVYESDPLGRLGYLQAQIFRAVRLVVDTGIHAKRWTREEAIAYMVDNTGMSVSDVTTEIERYIVQPGQACAYTPGKLEIVRLRDRARAELGARFDLKRFHTAVLGSGALPLTVLAEVVEAWIAEEKARSLAH